MATTSLIEVLRQELGWYASGELYKGRKFLVADANETVFAVVAFGNVADKRYADTFILVHREGDQVIIERDQTDRPVVESLVGAGIPREKIILAYAGEPVPESAALP